jgi:hypothetical protein
MIKIGLGTNLRPRKFIKETNFSPHCVEWQQFHFGYKLSGRSRHSTKFKFMVFESFEASSCSRCVVAFAAPA